MSLYGEIKNFLKSYLKNPIVIAAVGYLIYKLIQKHSQKKEESSEGLKILKKSPEGEIVLDVDTGKKFLVKDGDFELMEGEEMKHSEKLSSLREKVLQEKSPQDWNALLEAMKEKCRAVIAECDKWKSQPDRVFAHGYAEEKIDMLGKYLEEGKKALQKQEEEAKKGQ